MNIYTLPYMSSKVSYLTRHTNLPIFNKYFTRVRNNFNNNVSYPRSFAFNPRD